MLTRVEISGFKSFQDFALDFEPLLMVLGPNSAGKSNLFDALALISRLSSMELSTAMQGGRGSIRDQFSHTASGIADEMSFGIELLTLDTNLTGELAQNRWRYEVALSRAMLPSGIEQLNVAHEALLPIEQTADTWIASHPNFARVARYGLSEPALQLVTDADAISQAIAVGVNTTPKVLRGSVLERAAVFHDEPGADGLGVPIVRGLWRVAERTLLSERSRPLARHIWAVSSELLSWRFLHLGMAALRASSERGASTRLASDGSNLPTALAALPDATRARIQADLVELVPGLKALEVTTGSDELGLEATFSDGQRYPQRVLSDGTLRMLALLTMLHSSEPGALVAYEEPENGLFPGRLRELLRRLRELVQREDALPVQILLNGHSPAIVAGLLDLPGSLAFADLVRRKDGVRRTRIRRIATGAQPSDPATAVSGREVEALLDAARPEPAE